MQITEEFKSGLEMAQKLLKYTHFTRPLLKEEKIIYYNYHTTRAYDLSQLTKNPETTNSIDFTDEIIKQPVCQTMRFEKTDYLLIYPLKDDEKNTIKQELFELIQDLIINIKGIVVTQLKDDIVIYFQRYAYKRYIYIKPHLLVSHNTLPIMMESKRDSTEEDCSTFNMLDIVKYLIKIDAQHMIKQIKIEAPVVTKTLDYNSTMDEEEQVSLKKQAGQDGDADEYIPNDEPLENNDETLQKIEKPKRRLHKKKSKTRVSKRQKKRSKNKLKFSEDDHSSISSEQSKKKFLCEFCKKKYSRMDILKRHQKMNCSIAKQSMNKGKKYNDTDMTSESDQIRKLTKKSKAIKKNKGSNNNKFDIDQLEKVEFQIKSQLNLVFTIVDSFKESILILKDQFKDLEELKEQ